MPMNDIRTPEYKLEEYNARLIALYLFQYSILIPAMIFVNARLLVGVCSVLILMLALIGKSRIYINSRILFFTVAILFIIAGKTLIYQEGGYSVIVSYATIACPALYIVSLRFDKRVFMKTCYKLAVINFFLIFWIPFFSVGINYMKFGYGMAPTTVFLYCFISEKKETPTRIKGATIILFIISIVEILVFGARGSLIPIIILLVLDKIIIHKANYKLIVPIGLVTIAYLNIERIITYIFSIIDRLNIRSYALIKIRRQIIGGFAVASSGRDMIYAAAIERIKENPILGSDLIGGMNDSYTHNLFLQIAEEFGVFALVIFVLFLFYCISKIYNKYIQVDDRLVLATFFSLSMGRLLFSSSYWMRPEFWLFVGFAIVFPKSAR